MICCLAFEQFFIHVSSPYTKNQYTHKRTCISFSCQIFPTSSGSHRPGGQMNSAKIGFCLCTPPRRDLLEIRSGFVFLEACQKKCQVSGPASLAWAENYRMRGPVSRQALPRRWLDVADRRSFSSRMNLAPQLALTILAVFRSAHHTPSSLSIDLLHFSVPLRAHIRRHPDSGRSLHLFYFRLAIKSSMCSVSRIMYSPAYLYKFFPWGKSFRWAFSPPTLHI